VGFFFHLKELFHGTQMARLFDVLLTCAVTIRIASLYTGVLKVYIILNPKAYLTELQK